MQTIYNDKKEISMTNLLNPYLSKEGSKLKIYILKNGTKLLKRKNVQKVEKKARSMLITIYRYN